MNFRFKTLGFIILFVIFNACTSKEEHSSTSRISNKQKFNEVDFYDESLGFLKKLNSKNDVKNILLNNTSFNNRMIKLLGERYPYLLSKWNHEHKVEINDTLFLAEICDHKNCNQVDFIIIYTFHKDNLSVGIRDQETIETFSENKESASEINQWSNKK